MAVFQRAADGDLQFHQRLRFAVVENMGPPPIGIPEWGGDREFVRPETPLGRTGQISDIAPKYWGKCILPRTVRAK